MHKRWYLLTLTAMMLVFAASCGGSSTAPGQALGETQLGVDDDASESFMKAPEIPLDKGVATHEGAHGSLYADPEPDNFWSWTLAFGQDWCAGSASLVEDNGMWYVHYELSDEALEAGYLYCDAHVEIWENEGDEPKGIPGKFTYKWDANGDYSMFTDSVMLSLGDWTPPAGEFFLAIHATICTGYFDEDGNFVQQNEETGWASYCDTKNSEEPSWEGTWAKKWGGWVSSLDGTVPVFDPFDRTVNASSPYGSLAYWRVNFSPDGNYPFYPFADNGNPWPGWCTDPTGFRNGQLNRLISCYDPLLEGTYAESDHWDLISWMINERNDPTSPWYNYYYGYFQRAVWYFKYGNAGGMHLGSGGPGANYAATHPMVAPLIQAAKDNGENYVPGPGEYYAVLTVPVDTRAMIDPDGNGPLPPEPNPNYGGLRFGYSQVNIIEVDP